MKALWNGQVVAESDDTVLVEGNHYFPQSSLKQAFIEDSTKTTVCPWKGTAQYYPLLVDDQTNSDAVWYYPEPKPGADKIRDRVAFWRGVQVTD
jgi:uncharacterized protein (DUF427 family)